MSRSPHSHSSHGRTVKAQDLQYIVRPADEELFTQCCQGKPAYVFHSPQIGKSSLLRRTADRLNNESHHAIIADFSQFPFPPTEEAWFKKIVSLIDDHIDLATDALDWWNAHETLPPHQRVSEFIQDVVLAETNKPLVLFIDEIERLVHSPFRTHLFTWLATSYERRTTHPNLHRFSFVLCGVSTPTQLIPEDHVELFEWSQPIVLEDFTPQEAQPLAEGLSLPTEKALETFGWIYDWTGGHPYLTQLLCQMIEEQHRSTWTQEDVDDCIRHFLHSPQCLHDRNLQQVRMALTEPDDQGTTLLVPYLDLLEGKGDKIRSNPTLLARLQLAGIVRDLQGTITIRNKLYEELFSRSWVKRHTVVAESPNSRVPMAAAIVLVLGVGGLFWMWSTDSFPESPWSNPDPQNVAAPTRTVVSQPKEPTHEPSPLKIDLEKAQQTIQKLEATLVRHQKLSDEELAELRTQRTHLEEQLQVQTETLSDTQTQVASLKSTLSKQQKDQERRIAHLKNQQSNSQALLSTTQSNLHSAQEEIKTLQLALLQKSSLPATEVKKLMASREQLEATLTTAHRELAEAQNQVRNLTALISQQQIQLKNEKNHHHQEQVRQDKQYQSLQLELSRVRERLQTTEQLSQEQRQLAQQEASRLKQERDTLQDQLQASRQRVQQHQDHESELQATVADLNQTLQRSHRRHQDLLAKLEALTAQKNFEQQEAKTTIQEFQETVQTLTREKDQSRQLAEATIQEFNVKIQTLTQENHQSQQEATATIEDLKHQLVLHQKEEREFQGKFAQLESEWHTQRQEMKQSMKALQDEKIRLSAALRKANSQLETLDNQKVTLTEQLATAKNELDSKHLAIRSIHATSSETTRKLEEDLTHLQLTRSQLQTQLNSTQQGYQEAQDQIQRLEKKKREETSVLRQAVQDAQREKQTLTRKVAAAQKKLAQLERLLKKKEHEAKRASNSYQAQIEEYLPRITAALTNSARPLPSKTTRLLWARQAYLFSLQHQEANVPEIDPILRALLPTSPLRFTGAKAPIRTLSFHGTGNWLMGGTNTGSVLIWSLENPSTPQKYFNHWTNVLAIAARPDGQQFATGGKDTTIRLWSIGQSTSTSSMLKGHTRGVTALTFSPNGKTLVSGSQDHTIRFWDLTAKPFQYSIFGKHAAGVTSLDYTPDGKHLISSGADQRVLLWNLDEEDNPPRIISENFAKDGKFALHPFKPIIAHTTTDRHVALVNFYHPTPSPTVSTWTIKPGSPLEFSPDGEHLVTLGSDNRIRYWKWDYPQRVPVVLPHQTSPLEALAISPDGLTIASGGEDNVITLWNSTRQLADQVCQTVTRNLSIKEWRQILGENFPYERTCYNLPVHQTLIEEGERLAQQGYKKKARDLFERAKLLDPDRAKDLQLSIDKLTETSS